MKEGSIMGGPIDISAFHCLIVDFEQKDPCAVEGEGGKVTGNLGVMHSNSYFPVKV